jgi:RNA polymerase sigma-70 factor (ECF subfamily)
MSRTHVAHLLAPLWSWHQASGPDDLEEGTAAARQHDADIEACRRGDRDALSRVLTAHAAMLERLLARLVGPGADVEDLLQETFAGAIVSFPRFRGDARVGTWLYRIAINVAREELRRPHRRRTLSLELVAEHNEPLAAEPRPDHRAEARRQLEQLYGHLDKIDATKRIAFLLHVVADRPIAEVAAMMGASVAATKSRVFWARRALDRRLRRDPALRDLLGRTEGRRR